MMAHGNLNSSWQSFLRAAELITVSILNSPEPAKISMIDGLDGPLHSAVVLGEVGVVCKVCRQ